MWGLDFLEGARTSFHLLELLLLPYPFRACQTQQENTKQIKWKKNNSRSLLEVSASSSFFLFFFYRKNLYDNYARPLPSLSLIHHQLLFLFCILFSIATGSVKGRVLLPAWQRRYSLFSSSNYLFCFSMQPSRCFMWLMGDDKFKFS